MIGRKPTRTQGILILFLQYLLRNHIFHTYFIPQYIWNWMLTRTESRKTSSLLVIYHNPKSLQSSQHNYSLSLFFSRLYINGPSSSTSTTLSLIFRFFSWNTVCISHLSYMCNMLHQLHPSWCSHLDNNWQVVVILMKILVFMQTGIWVSMLLRQQAFP